MTGKRNELISISADKLADVPQGIERFLENPSNPVIFRVPPYSQQNDVSGCISLRVFRQVPVV